MKKIWILLILSLSLILCSACTATQANQAQDSAAASSEVSSSGSSGAVTQTVLTTQSSSAAASSSETLATGDVIDITEKMYVTYINDIYTNPDDYLGKTIQIEGMFAKEYYDETDTTYYYVYRTGPGCCGNDGSMCGFEFTYDGQMPADNDWIQVIGTLCSYEEGGLSYLTLDASSVTVMTERGAETVYR